jgi:hypothetical protein
MAEEKKPKERKKRIEPETKDSTLATAAKIVGAAAGKIASLRCCAAATGVFHSFSRT